MEESVMSDTNETKVWTTKVIEENGELILLFPPELMEETKWKEGDALAWVVSDDGYTCYIRKLETP
jgi:hypothetical protein